MKFEQGQKYRLRNGFTAIIDAIIDDKHLPLKGRVLNGPSPGHYKWNSKGAFYDEGRDGYDIIAVLPKVNPLTGSTMPGW